MHPLHDYVAKQLGEKVKSRSIVVWYDKDSAFGPFVGELRGKPRTSADPLPISVGGVSALLLEYAGSMFELRALAEPHVRADSPDAIVLYLGGCERNIGTSVLLELEKAGDCYEPQLAKLGRQVLRQRYTDGVIDEMLAPKGITYEDIARASSATSSAEPPSVLKSIFHDTTGNDGLLAAWLVSEDRDGTIATKDATGELCKLLRSRLGLELASMEGSPLAKLRAITLRYVLAGEFRSDLSCPPPASLEGIPVPKSKEEELAVRDLALRLRTGFPDAYADLADRVELELGLRTASLSAGSLGAIDTFRFEERALLSHCGELIAQKKFDAALSLVGEREQSFWLDRDVARKAQWEACRRMADLGKLALSVRAAVQKATGDANAWVDAYTAKDGWFRLDQAQRRLEAWRTSLDEEPEERALGVVRREYEDTCHAMAEGFTKAFGKAGWTISGSLHQTRIYSEIVASRPKPVAYFFVDAMRFEMGVELAERLPRSSELSVTHAIAALPSITPIGMAALLPGASASFDLTAEGGKLGARIDDTFLPDSTARKRLAAARIPHLADMTLDELLSLQPSRLAKKIEGAQVVIVRSQEIDHAGETGFTNQARQVMDTVIDNLARAIRKLAGAGVEHAVVSADHGHLFYAEDRDESMRTDSPGGTKVELHRRCWIGKGGTTPAASIRVPASALGYASDLDLVFPTGAGVFKAGGDLAFHHGGPSLQEVVIPVVTVRTKVRESTRPTSGAPITASGLPDAVTNRIFSVKVTFGERQMMLGATSLLVRPMLVAGGKQVGSVGMVVDAELDAATGCVTLEPNKPAMIVFKLNDENAQSVRVVIQDPSTDADLYRSPKDIPVRLGV